ncbi:MAG: acetyl-CoA C-acyltransferase [Candidatus Eisenbacteria bacterium]
MDGIVILAGARTPFCEYQSGKRGDGQPGGRFADMSAIDLAAVASKEAMARAGVDPGAIDHAVFGNAMQTSGDALYGARHVALKAGLPVRVPALTVNRICGSGLQSIVTAAQMVRLGEASAVLAGGMENLSQAPHVLRGLRGGLKLGQGKLEDSLMVALLDTYCGLYMAQTAEKLSARFNTGRDAQDAFAVESQRRAAAAREAGLLAEEIVPVPLPARRGAAPVLVEEDDHLKPGTTLEALAALPPAFSKEGTVTAGNASGIVDGAAAVVVASESFALARSAAGASRPVLATIRGWSTVGVEPSEMGIGPAPAIRSLLEKASLPLDAIDLFEINEAFAAQILPVLADLDLDRDRVNVHGGAIAIGHPLGATGTRLALTLALELRRRRARYGVASACIGGGQGIALLLENPEAARTGRS